MTDKQTKKLTNSNFINIDDKFYFLAGSPPNFVVLQTLDDDYGSKGGRHPLSYATWMAFSVPLMLVNTFMAWVLITIIQRIQIGPEQTSKERIFNF